MNRTFLRCALLASILPFSPLAQTTQAPNFAGAGVSYQPGASPAIAGTGLYARLVAGTGTYAFTVLDALPASYTPFTVTTQVGVGIAQKLFTLDIAGRSIPVYIPTSAGIAWTGSNTGWGWSTGALASIPITGSWRIMPNVRAAKSSVNGNSGYQLIGGALIGWGW